MALNQHRNGPKDKAFTHGMGELSISPQARWILGLLELNGQFDQELHVLGFIMATVSQGKF